MTFPQRVQYAATYRRRLRWAAVVATPWWTLSGGWQGIGGMETGGVLRVRVGSAWTKRAALQLAGRHIASAKAIHQR